MAAHRYWRVIVDSTSDASWTLISRLRLRSTGPNGPNEAAGRAGGGSTTQSAYHTSTKDWRGWRTVNTDDGDSAEADYWEVNAGSGAWVSVDLGQAREIMTLDLRSGNVFPTENPKNFRLQWSDDNSAWTDHITVADQTGWGTYEWRQFSHGSAVSTTPTAYRFWRVRATTMSGGGNPTQPGELEFRATAGGAALSGRPLASYSIYDTDNIFDQDLDNASSNFEWSGAPSTAPKWAGLDFGVGVNQTVAELAVQAHNTFGNRMWLAGWVEKSVDAITWEQVAEIPAQSIYGSEEQRLFTVTVPSASGRAARLLDLNLSISLTSAF